MPQKIIHLILIIFAICLTANTKSISQADSLLNLLTIYKQDTNRVIVLNQLADLNLSSNSKEAKSYAQEALKVSTAINYLQGQSEAYFLMTYANYFTGNYEEGVITAEQCISISKQTGEQSKASDAHYILGFILAEMGKIEDARINYQKVVEISEKVGYTDGRFKGLKGLGDLEEIKGDYQQALIYYEKVLEGLLKAGLPKLQIAAYNDIGRIRDQMGDAEAALVSYLEGYKIAEKQGNDYYSATLASNIASLHFYQKNYPKTTEYATISRDAYEKIGNQKGIAKTQQTLANVQFNQGNYEKAMEYYRSSAQICEKIGYKRGASFAYFNIAKTYNKQGSRQQAKIYHQKSLTLREDIGFKIGIAQSTSALGLLYLEEKNFDRAIDYLSTSLKLAQESGALNEIENAYSSLARSYAGKGDFTNAYKFQVLNNEISDSLFNKDQTEQIVLLQTRYETEKKEDQINYLEQEAKLNLLTIEKNKQLRYLLIAGMILFIISTILYFSRSRIKVKANLQLKEKNLEIEESNRLLNASLLEKEALLKEIHHRVKNNLQIISSLLNLQSNQGGNEAVVMKMREGQSRVEAMSLIHQNLYQSSSLQNISIEDYLSQLCKYLSRAFNPSGKSIQTNINASGISFDIDTAIPLGLIVNELVSNAYKHAFTNQDLGQVNVHIKKIDADFYEMTVADNGAGLPDGFDINKQNSLGIKLIRMLATMQLKGDFSYHNDNGSIFTIHFKDIRKSLAESA